MYASNECVTSIKYILMEYIIMYMYIKSLVISLITLSLDRTEIPRNFSMRLYDIHSSSKVSETASRPVRFLMRLRPRDKTLKLSEERKVEQFYFIN